MMPIEVFFLLALLPSAKIQAPAITELGIIQGAPSPDRRGVGPRAINDLGQVVGSYGRGAFIWTEKNGMKLLEANGFAFAINNLGDATGRANDKACIWKVDGSRTIIPDIPGVEGPHGFSINDRGDVIVGANRDVHNAGFVFTKGEIHDLSTNAVTALSAGEVQPWKITNNGEIIGATQALTGVGFYLRSLDSKFMEIAAPDGKHPLSPTCVSGTKVYCSVGTTTNPESPVVFDTQTGKVNTLDWPKGTFPQDANANGWVVGQVEADGQRIAFVFSPAKGFRYLKNLLPGAWDLQSATSINGRNEIVGYGIFGGRKRGFIFRGLQ